jgi:hypothetical protein
MLAFFDTLHASNRLGLPLKGVPITGCSNDAQPRLAADAAPAALRLPVSRRQMHSLDAERRAV